MAMTAQVSAWQRSLTYTALCVTGEVVFTGLKNFPLLQGFTQLWVFPLYAIGSIYAFEPLHEKLRDKPLFVRAAVYASMIFALEYFGGWAAEKLIGVCPWKYTSPLSVHGYINLSYFPLWCAVGILAEKLHNYFLTLSIIRK